MEVCGVTNLVILWIIQRPEYATGMPPTLPSATDMTSPPKVDETEGDMLDFDPAIFNDDSVYKSALLAREFLWPEGVMYYRFDPNMTMWVRLQVRKAMKKIEQNSCVRFVMYKPDMNVDEWYQLEPSPLPRKCASSIGLICKNATLNCKHRMEIGEDCPLGTLVHELLHALGFVHEQSRGDRDDYIIVHTQNIQQGRVNQFEKYRFPLRQSTPYDLGSIMHYGPDAFMDEAKRLPTIQSKVPLPEGVKMGQRSKLSPYDVEKLNALYNCDSISNRFGGGK